eukprot:581738-Amphidinium_carterae.1
MALDCLDSGWTAWTVSSLLAGLPQNRKQVYRVGVVGGVFALTPQAFQEQAHHDQPRLSAFSTRKHNLRILPDQIGEANTAESVNGGIVNV